MVCDNKGGDGKEAGAGDSAGGGSGAGEFDGEAVRGEPGAMPELLVVLLDPVELLSLACICDDDG
jgi:hypothetical protein